MKKKFNQLKSALIIASLSIIPFSSVYATLAKVDGSSVVPKILAGGTDASNGAPLLPAGAFTGVVSISINTDEGGFICTGSVISKRHIITAGHCVEDNSDTGTVIDISSANFNVSANFADGGNINTVVSAASVDIHPDYDGFANCGVNDVTGFDGACLNDDIAIITLSEDIPPDVEIYAFSEQPMDGQLLTMVGHGTSGNGITGGNISPSFSNKRIGFNVAEIFDCDDGTSTINSGGFFDSATCDANFNNEAEVWYADFDGFDAGGVFQDTWCDSFDLGCDEIWLGETFSQPYNFDTLFEGNIGGGDSGGPSFVFNAVTDKFELIANNTFGAGSGSYGSWFGGNIYAGYKSFIGQFVPEISLVSAPSGLSMMLLAFGILGLKRRNATIQLT